MEAFFFNYVNINKMGVTIFEAKTMKQDRRQKGRMKKLKMTFISDVTVLKENIYYI